MYVRSTLIDMSNMCVGAWPLNDQPRVSIHDCDSCIINFFVRDVTYSYPLFEYVHTLFF